MPSYRSARGPLALLLTGVLLLGACGSDDPEPAGEPEAETDVTEPTEDAPDELEGEAADDPDADGEELEEEPAEPEVDPAEVGADELGLIPVFMYHQLLEDGGSEYDLTPEEYREELTRLFDEGYRPITTAQLATGEIDVPAGTTPMVLTYDDSTASQARLTEDGELDPDTALGILVELAEQYDDVEPRASVYVISGSLFGGTAAGEQVLEVLHEHGMEIGNHTHTHPSLASLDDAGVQEELATNVAVVTDLVPGTEVTTLSLPLGIFPENRELAARGTADVGDYEHAGILLVGAEPAPSPFHAEFDPLAIPRVRSSPGWSSGDEPDWGSAFWLEQLERGETYRRYVSDGNPDTISFPAERADELDPALEDRANPY